MPSRVIARERHRGDFVCPAVVAVATFFEGAARANQFSRSSSTTAVKC